MELKGSCHCEKVTFKVVSNTPAPFMHCYCSICRKCQGGSGAAINIMGLSKTLEITSGKEHLKGYQALMDKEKKKLAGNIRYFCNECGSHLYAYDEQYKDYVYPYASAIDTNLPELKASDRHHIMLSSKANWVPSPPLESKIFDEYPDCSLEDWHKKNNKYVE
ncbi:hypothetical protein G6F57_005578 [Rhizopus arrhizus]|uniref:CENP-V/GFA domain-containing protein n=1 Tax=Rhizopus oryzae TaxID=64495 RepID=A0A9P7BQ03_RHIOR|nr:hypothetical protein G6F23_009236 [Rhizopus arrhizus]KAG1249235.1 hypothetical protein G6F68_013444 [Rhizopus microsporus]KAG0763827.1 hypothetical protein G6F24_005718 [Rhizopus arrhizus]KAG0784283.1 hypothetical protein G6F22_008372 [Rhizopus arrhizus]KAG0786005.1 hypothetical protein G6F21_008888 [Rhizopus arrhizus]